MKDIFSVFVIISLLLFSACDKSGETSSEKDPQGLNAAAKHSAPLAIESAPLHLEQITGDPLKSFKGCLEPGNLSQKSALNYLEILVAGNHETISYYREFGQWENSMLKGSGEEWYQNDICTAVKVLSEKKNPEAYDLIVQAIENKTKYPKIMVCTIRAIMIFGNFRNGLWHGDKRSIPVLKKVLNDEDPEIRLNTAGALLSLGEGSIALPVIDELAKSGTKHSVPAIYRLFAPEEILFGSTKRIVRSKTRMFDKRGKDILVKALNYPSDEVKVFSALKLVHMGIELRRAETTAINVLKQYTGRRRKGYRDMDEQQSEKNTIYYAIDVLESTATTNSKEALQAFSESCDMPLFKEKSQNALKNIRQKNNILNSGE